MKVISTNQTNKMNSLSILFYKMGFSFVSYDESGVESKVSHFKVVNLSRWEDEIVKELEVNLRLRRNYNQVRAAFVSSFFNLVPNKYTAVSDDVLLNLSEAEFEINDLLTVSTKHESSFVFGVSQLVLEKLNELYTQIEIFHSGNIFVDQILFSNNPELHLNLIESQLEIVVTNEKGIVFYNIFDVQSDEDILFYALFVTEQLNLDLNKVDLKCYGQLLPAKPVYQLLRKYVRYVLPASKNETFLENYSLHNLVQCVSYPETLEEKK